MRYQPATPAFVLRDILLHWYHATHRPMPLAEIRQRWHETDLRDSDLRDAIDAALGEEWIQPLTGGTIELTPSPGMLEGTFTAEQ